jgi:hypothetical protein
LERGIRRTIVLLGVGEVASGATVLAEFEIRHFPQALANLFDVLWLKLNHCVLRGEETGGQDNTSRLRRTSLQTSFLGFQKIVDLSDEFVQFLRVLLN